MRAAKTKTSCTKPAGGIKRSCQERAGPDVATPKAMKDPNWRTRHDASSSTDIENLMPSMDQLNSKVHPQAASSYSNHSSHQDRGSSDFSIVDRCSSEASSASESFVKILKKIDLEQVDGRQMSIFELDLRPETPTPAIASNDRRFAKVSRNAASHQQDSSSATRVTASLQGTDNTQTPDVFQLLTVDRLCRQSSSVTSSHSPLNESRGIYDRDKDTGVLFGQSVPGARDRTPVDGSRQSPQTAIRNSRDQAFRRLIRRLNGDSHSSTSQASQPPMTNQATHKPPAPELANRPLVNLRRPLGGGGRRNQTISDFKVDYWEHSQSSKTSREGSEATVQKSSSRNTWNPKAREFLSIGHQQNSRRPPLSNTGVSGSQEAASSNFSALPAHTMAAWTKPNAQPSAPYQSTSDQDSVPNGTFNPPVPTAAPACNMGLGPETFSLTHFLPGGSALQPHFFTAQHVPSIQAPIMPFGSFSAQQAAAQQAAAQQLAAQQIAALPYLASLASLGPPPSLLTGLEKPNLTANIRRPAVPKPTLPNAGAQLAYEEWIEWRKANEPGYAVECKARQQRRSQRVKGPKEGGGDKPAESCLAPVTAVAAS